MLGRRVTRWSDPVAARLLRQVERWRCVATAPLAWIYHLSDQQPVIDADVRRWGEILQVPDHEHLRLRMLYAFPEFRGVYYHRLRRGNPTGALLARAGAWLWPSVPGLDLEAARIGPGLFLSHGQGTILAAERIGANAYVQHGVTVGWDYRSHRLPRIGDDVFIGAGAKILGAVTIGDGARIGANAVVLCDVPPRATAVGMPARILSGNPDRLRPEISAQVTQPEDQCPGKNNFSKEKAATDASPTR
ncbi:MAG: serine O-acetyltransferase [Acidimicrobiales bacterium]